MRDKGPYWDRSRSIMPPVYRIRLTLPFYVIEKDSKKTILALSSSPTFQHQNVCLIGQNILEISNSIFISKDSICFLEWCRKLFHINTPLFEILYLHLIRFVLGILLHSLENPVGYGWKKLENCCSSGLITNVIHCNVIRKLLCLKYSAYICSISLISSASWKVL